MRSEIARPLETQVCQTGARDLIIGYKSLEKRKPALQGGAPAFPGRGARETSGD